MKEQKSIQDTVALWTLFLSIGAIMILAFVVIYTGKAGDSMTIFNTVLPVFASWIGTILAYYFGKENFKSANNQVQEMVKSMSVENKEEQKITSIMRAIYAMALYKISSKDKVKNITMGSLEKKFKESRVSRLPIVDKDNHILYMVHESQITKYLVNESSKKEDTLEKFIQSINYSIAEDSGFVVVSQKTSLKEAKEKMEKNPSCKDIFITENGTSDEPIIGWISNIRLSKYLQA